MTDASTSSTLFTWLLFGSKVVGGLLLTLTLLLYANQEKILYIPNPPGFPKNHHENPPGFNSPSDWGRNGRLSGSEKINFEENFVKTSDGHRIHTWLLLQPQSENKPTLVYFHGNAGNMGFRLKNAALMYAKSDINILMMDYRGYGSSEGTPTEAGLNLDGEAVLKFAKSHPKLTNSKVILFGRSLGGAVAVSLAHRYPTMVAGVVLENTFLSIARMVDVLMPAVKHLKHIVLHMKWDSAEKIQKLKCPVMFISGDSDELVPPQHMKELFEHATQASFRDFYSVFGGSHNNTWEVAGADYYLRLRKFIYDHVMNATSAANFVDTPKLNSDGTTKIQDEEEDYYVVDKDSTQTGALPTMGTNFMVK